MTNIALFSTLGVSVLAIIFSFVLARQIGKKPAGSKKMADVSKPISAEIKIRQTKNLKDFSLVAIILFTGIIYAFGWQAAASFLAGAVVFILTDRYLMNLSDKTALRLAEASKSGLSILHKLNYNLAAVTTFLTAGTGVLIFSGCCFAFKDQTTILAMALSAILVSFFSFRAGKLNFFGSYLTILAVVVALAQNDVSTYQNAEIFPLIFAAFAIVITAICGLFAKINPKTLNLSAVFYRGLAIISILFLAAAYFGPKYILAISDKMTLIKLVVVLVIGLILSLATIFLRQIPKIVPTLTIALAVLFANYFAGTYGVSLVAIGFLTLWPLIYLIDSFTYQIKNAETIALSAEMSPEAVGNIKILAENKIETANYFLSLFGIAATCFILLYFLEYTSINFSLADPKFFSGLFAGGALAYLLDSQIIINKIFKIAAAVIVTILAGVTLGPILLAGVLIGVLLIELLVNQTISFEVLLMLASGVLVSKFIEIEYSLAIRSIIAGAVIILVVGYFIIEKFYGKSIKVGK